MGKLFFAAILECVLGISPAFAISGTLNAGNSNWSGNEVLTGPVIVPAGVTLTIAPGTYVSGNFSITANGPVSALGTLASHVDFYGTNLILNNAGAQHVLQYCIVLNSAANAIAVANANVKFSHLQIQDFGANGVEITGAGSQVVLEYATIGAKSRLFGGTNAVSVNIENGADAANISVSNSILGFEDKSYEIGLNILGTGGSGANSSTVKVQYCLITGPRSGSGSGEVGILTGVNADVKDIPNLNYHLWPYSNAIDAGDPTADYSAEPTPNGGRVDLGYYGGTPEATPFQFQIVTPNGGDSLSPGKSAAITWLGGKFLAAKKLDLSIDSAKTWQPIAASYNDQGSGAYTWTVPAVRSPNCLVRLALAGNGLGITQSGRVFTIGDTVSPTVGGGALTNPTPFRCIPFSAYHDGQQPGGAEPAYAQIVADVVMMKPFTRELRTYGSGAGTFGNFMPRICDSLGMSVHLGIWIDDTYPAATNQQSINDAIALMKQGHPSIKTIIVGNEYLLRVAQAHGDVAGAQSRLIAYIKTVKAATPAGIAVATAEPYSTWATVSDSLIQAVDVVLWHVHPWWEQQSIDNAASWAYSAYTQMTARLAKFPGKPQILAETGWPTAANNGAAVGSEANQARYLKELHAWARKINFPYWFFTNVDENWKSSEGPVGAHWGMWNADRTPKAVITGLATEIPASTYWDNSPNSTALFHPVLQGVRSANSGLGIYDLQGRWLGSPNKNTRRQLGYAPEFQIGSARKAALLPVK